MNHIFIEVLNRSFGAIFLILAVMVVRLAIKRAPKWISCALWGLVALKLLLPFNIESVLSLVPGPAPIPEDIAYSEAPHIEVGIPAIDQAVNPIIETNFAPQPTTPVNPMQTMISVCTGIWAVGIAVLLVYLGVSYFLLRKRVAASKRIQENVYICDEIAGPFILGVVRPGIYLPSGLAEETKECVLEHEKTHIKRLDHLWKPLGYLILTVYWFNPLCWFSYMLLCKDIELACDEKVTKDRDNEWKAIYCQALLDCSIQRKMITACPVAFGEVSIKDRVRSVLHYRKPAFWIVVAALAVSIVVAVCFVTNPKPKEKAASEPTMEDSIEPHDSEAWEEEQRSDRYSGSREEIIGEGSFDNIMGYAGNYVFFDAFPTFGYYYAEDGTLLAQVWGTRPEEVGIVDLDMDGSNELIAQLVYGDGGSDVVVYKKFPVGIRQASCLDLLDKEYDDVGLGSLAAEYLKDTNEVKISYYIAKEDKTYDVTYPISIAQLYWWEPAWVVPAVDSDGGGAKPGGSTDGGGTGGGPVDTETDAGKLRAEREVISSYKELRKWSFGPVTDIVPGPEDALDVSISLQYYVLSDDVELIEELGLTEEDFPNGYDFVPTGDTKVYSTDEDCEYILLDEEGVFEHDSRVSVYDNTHIVTKDRTVFLEYMDMEDILNTENERYGVHHPGRNDRLFFYDIQEGAIKTIYEPWLP